MRLTTSPGLAQFYAETEGLDRSINTDNVKAETWSFCSKAIILSFKNAIKSSFKNDDGKTAAVTLMRLLNHPAMFNIHRNSLKFFLSKIKYEERKSALGTSSSGSFIFKAKHNVFEDIRTPDAC